MRRRLRAIAGAAAVSAGVLSLAPSPAAALDMPPWPPPAPAPPFPAGTPTPAPAPSLGPAPAAAPAAAPVAAPPSASLPTKDLQQRLKDLAYDPGKIDGVFGPATRYAVYAFQKVQGMKPTGVVDANVRAGLANPQSPPVVGSGGDRVDIDLGRQLLMAYRGGRLVLISHISSGSGKPYCENGRCGTTITPKGSFSILWSRSGWETAPLGRLYNPQYFTTAGHAIHGSTSVPLYPASHGCVRIPMHTAGWFPTIVYRGMPVYVGG